MNFMIDAYLPDVSIFLYLKKRFYFKCWVLLHGHSSISYFNFEQVNVYLYAHKNKPTQLGIYHTYKNGKWENIKWGKSNKNESHESWAERIVN